MRKGLEDPQTPYIDTLQLIVPADKMELLQKAKTGVMVHICNPAALGRLRQED
jgi:hypothetical protein